MALERKNGRGEGVWRALSRLLLLLRRIATEINLYIFAVLESDCGHQGTRTDDWENGVGGEGG